ncbi:MAG TPA: class I adenylate-forming enzyme family protein [Candidatus Polarisedimenticolia bacterium]|nr:class I adenylate-forming enzyme family protein [Candidatus Polarisedimenticolia bacterium]
MSSPRELFDRCAASLAASSRPAIAGAGTGGQAAVGGEELLSAASGLADELRRTGVSEGSLVLLEALPPAAFVTALLAVWERGAAALPADPATPEAELLMLRERFLPSHAVAAGPEGPRARRLSGQAGGPGSTPPGCAVMKLTSGSTGRPRGIPCTARQLAADGRQIIAGMGLRPEDVNVAAVPLSHSYGLGSLVMPLVLHGSTLLVADPRVPETLARALSIEEPAVFPGVPYLFSMLARPDAPSVRVRGLRLCLSAGARLPAEAARAFRGRTGLPVRVFYGASEAGGICFDASDDGSAAELEEGCVGTPLPGVEVALDEATQRVAVRSAAVAGGYSGTDEPGGESPFREGSFLTGDTARWRLAAGRRELVLTGRVGEVVNVAGRKVDPKEIERALRALDGVREAVALGVGDAVRGESLVACLAAGPGVTRDRVMAHLRAELAAWKLPKKILFYDDLPRNERGKHDMEALRRAAGGPEREAER